MSTLVVDLDARVAKKYKISDIASYFTRNDLKWWRELSSAESYKGQECAVEKLLRTIRPKKILEIGPGFGRITKLLVEHAPKLTLIECNRRALKQLRAQFPKATIVEADATACDLGSGYDLIAVLEVLVHIPDIPSLMKKIQAALDQKGYVLVSISPLEWYAKNYKRKTATHRGIDIMEFENCIRQLFRINEVFHSKNKQHYMYVLSHLS